MRPTSKSRWNARRAAAATLVAGLAIIAPLLACGPFFPNRLLDAGDDALLAAPEAIFAAEILRIQVPKPPWPARPATHSAAHEETTAAADVEDLRSALVKLKLPLAERVALTKAYEVERAKLLRPPSYPPPSVPPPARVSATPLAGLPAEFRDYFDGALAWRNADTNAAVTAWKTLLERPPGERRFKSTWAAFMLGKATLGSDPDRATNYFQLTRQLASEGFPDSLGLAAASLGWEARVHFDAGRYLPAIELYLQQAAAGDPSALVSLRWTAARALRLPPDDLRRFARHPLAHQVLTTYLIAHPPEAWDNHDTQGRRSTAHAWLTAVEAARARDLAAAEPLALLAYQHGDLPATRRWLKLAPDTPVTQWLQAKLLLRDGQVDRAAALLARLAPRFPIDPAQQREQLARNLVFPDAGRLPRPAAERLRGELGALQLARRDYADALESLLRAGFWDDAAYVAERVLTLPELQSFVDRHWSNDPEFLPPLPDEDLTEAERDYRQRLVQTRAALRHLLARRLHRAGQTSEAVSYFPQELAARCVAFREALAAGDDESRPAEERADRLMAAARIARHEGLELLGTELAPDFFIHAGNFSEGVDITNRQEIVHPEAGYLEFGETSPPPRTNRVHASSDETRRARSSGPDPDAPFHYRYVGAAMAWSAARLLADNTDTKARYLCEAGSWIKYQNPKAADLFYKELVRKCRRTEIGRLADEIRWFPLLDAQGNLRPRQPSPPKRSAIAESPPDPDPSSAVLTPESESLPSSDDADPPVGPDPAP